MLTFFRDLRMAGRTLRQNPGFAATALLTIALGIGASTAIFSVVNAVLLRPLPYKDPRQLVLIWQELRARNVPYFPFPPGDYADLKQQGTLLDGVAAINTGRQSISGDGRAPEQVRTAGVTTNFFSLLGARIELGRDFTDADGTPNAAPPPPGPAGANAAAAPAAPPLPPMVMLSHEFWERHFGADRSVVGSRITLGPPPAPGQPAQTVEVVGVLAPGFEVLFPPSTNIERVPDMYFALRTDFANGSRTNVNLRVIGRMKPGVTVSQVQAQMDGFAADLRQRFPVKTTADLRINVFKMHDDLVADVRPAILALMGAVGFVLLIACANVANLLLARASRRERELAVRTALGSSRARLVRQMLAESLVVSVAGAVAGLLLARIGIRVLAAIGPANLPRLDEIAIDPWVLGFTALMSLVAAGVFGLVPALRASRPNVIDILRSSGRQSSLSGGRALRSGVVVAEVALSFVLLIGSGLMVRSFIAVQHVNPGFDPDNLLTFATPNLRAVGPDATAALMRNIQQQLGALPGVLAVTAGLSLPLDGTIGNLPYGPEAAAGDPRLMRQADANFVLPGYFSVMKTPIIEGREYTEADNRPEMTGVVIDSVLAAKLFGGQPATGKHLLMRIVGPTYDPYEVLGVVQQQRRSSLARPGREAIYIVDGKVGHGAATRWAVRTSGDPNALISAVRTTLAKIDPAMVLVDIQPESDYVLRAQAPTRFALVLIGVFAAIAATLASIGLYGVLATLVRQRTAEIGVRMAFGADRGGIFRLIIGYGLKLSGVGIAIGATAAFFLTKAMDTMVVGIKPNDPLTFVSIAVLFFVVATLACAVPAFRASRLDPTAALRE